MIAHTARIVVIADVLFTATAVIIQPVSGAFLALGWSAIRCSNPGSSFRSSLYVMVGLCWLPVVWIQMQMRDLARRRQPRRTAAAAALSSSCSAIWFCLGWPAFSA